jgi:DNA-binding helix-hairpin-helix protein with protein kinase domain
LTAYYTGNGRTIKPSAFLGKGGEGTVFSIQNENDLAVKLYLPNLAAERHAKIAYMVSAKLHASATFAAYPIDTVFASDGRFSGFTMRIMPGRKPAHQLYSPDRSQNCISKGDVSRACEGGWKYCESRLQCTFNWLRNWRHKSFQCPSI